MTNNAWDTEKAEWRYDNFKFFLARKGLYPPIGLYLARILIEKPLPLLMSSTFIDFIFWFAALSLINIPIKLAVVASITIVSSQSLFFVAILMSNKIVRILRRNSSINRRFPVSTTAKRSALNLRRFLLSMIIPILITSFRFVITVMVISLFIDYTGLNIFENMNEFAESNYFTGNNYSIFYFMTFMFTLYPLALIFLSRNMIKYDPISALIIPLATYAEPLIYFFISRSVASTNIYWELLAILLLAQSLLYPLSFMFSIISSLMLVVTRGVFGLARIRANVLGITFLAAVIPFISADAWQLITGLGWTDLIKISALVYILPIFLLLYSQRSLIINEIYNNVWIGNNNIDISKLMLVYKTIKVPPISDMEKYITNGYSGIQNSSTQDLVVVVIKYCIKAIFLLTFLPLAVMIFSLILFYFMLDNRVLAEWISGFPTTVSAHILSINLDGFTILRLKSSILLGVFSATSTFGTLINSKSDLLEFITNYFGEDILLDKHLLILFRVIKKGTKAKITQKLSTNTP